MDVFNRQTDLSGLFKFSHIKPEIRSHLAKTYAALTACMVVASIGSAMSVVYGLGGTGTGLLAIVCLIGMYFSGEKSLWKPGFFLGFGFFKGLSLGPLISMSLQIDPQILVTAFLCTSCIFICMSLAALVSESRSYLYLGGLLGTGMLVLLLLNVLMMFGFRSEFLFNLNLGIGLLMFMGYVIYDTQLVIARAEHGNKDFWGSAAELFIDFVAIFVRILIILSKNAKKEEK